MWKRKMPFYREVYKYVEKGHSLTDTGKQFGLSRERIRQILRDAFGANIMVMKKANPGKYSKKTYLSTKCVVCGKKIVYYKMGKKKPILCCGKKCFSKHMSGKKHPSPSEETRRKCSEARKLWWVMRKERLAEAQMENHLTRHGESDLIKAC